MLYEFSQTVMDENLKFIAPVVAGTKIDIVFTEQCFAEEYIEPGMRATLVLAQYNDEYESESLILDTIYEFQFDLTPFKDFNVSIETPAYADSLGYFTLKASEV